MKVLVSEIFLKNIPKDKKEFVLSKLDKFIIFLDTVSIVVSLKFELTEKYEFSAVRSTNKSIESHILCK